MAAKKKFPKRIVVTLEAEGERDEYLQVHAGFDEAAEAGLTKSAAVYQLVETGTVATETIYKTVK